MTTLALASPPSRPLSKYSSSLPFLRRPPFLTGQFAGDVGFDPFQFATSYERLLYYREAEIKHARIAMLAAVGWPLSETFDRPIAQELDRLLNLDLPSTLDSHDRVPSLLNGGMDAISPVWWGFCLGLTAAVDVWGIQQGRYYNNNSNSNTDSNSSKNENDTTFTVQTPSYLPGDYGFDPLRLYPRSDTVKQHQLQLAEIKHGRLSMLAITGFAIQEYVSGVGVVQETPGFFRPWEGLF